MLTAGGKGKLVSLCRAPGHGAADELLTALRDVYRTAAATEHPNWEEYDQAMVEQGRSAIIVVPEHIYGGNVS